ncbi:MAG: hypothetical protein Q9222_000950 [Ikaeria aurantiellina]
MAVEPLTPIAIVGLGLRMPGKVTDPAQFWTILEEGRDCWTSVPRDRFNETAFYHANADNLGTQYHRGGHFLDQDVAAFDAAFFQIPQPEAEAMDPQQRILLETTYDAFQSCGYAMTDIRGSDTAVYIATFGSDYDRILSKDVDDLPKYHTTGTGEAIAANRISYTFDLRGPSVALDTGCSGSLVALHQACQSLRTGEVQMAVAGGVNLILSPDRMIGMTNLSRGSGYGRGEGVGVLILKTLDEATRCGDPVRAVIRNTGVNQDGRTPGITFPSQEAQERLLRKTYERVGIDPGTIHYVEAHGTGTFAGDRAEIGALSSEFCANRQMPLYVGSVKSNIGHLESASGVASVLKAVLVLEKDFIPPNANFQKAKPELRLAQHKIIVRTRSQISVKVRGLSDADTQNSGAIRPQLAA